VVSFQAMSKSEKIAVMVKKFRGRVLDEHYLAYFDYFNRQLFYESHDVLENLWLPIRREHDGAFYKGLIQLAGAFVHLQKNRLQPAAALFKMARANLEGFAPTRSHLDVTQVLMLIDDWLNKVEANQFSVNPLTPTHVPRLELPGVFD
jgi:predicted metal-dependent hydrolase